MIFLRWFFDHDEAFLILVESLWSRSVGFSRSEDQSFRAHFYFSDQRNFYQFRRPHFLDQVIFILYHGKNFKDRLLRSRLRSDLLFDEQYPTWTYHFQQLANFWFLWLHFLRWRPNFLLFARPLKIFLQHFLFLWSYFLTKIKLTLSLKNLTITIKIKVTKPTSNS